MTDQYAYKYPSPLTGYEDAPPLSDTENEDKSMLNPKNTALSKTYDNFDYPLNNGDRGGFDVHIYYFLSNLEQVRFAKKLHIRIRLQFPELRIYRFWDRAVGPHPIAMFEVNLFTPAQFGAFIPWLIIWRGPLSVLVHPNTEEAGVNALDAELRNHTQRATWIGDKVPIDLTLFYRAKENLETMDGTQVDSWVKMGRSGEKPAHLFA